MNTTRALLATTPLLLALAAACGGPESSTDTPSPASSPDVGVTMAADGGVSPTTPDSGVPTPDAGPQGPTECPDGYVGEACDRCAPGYQDGNADGICSLACDATGELAPQCGHGRCFIDPELDARACACETGYVGEACDQCDTGYADLAGDGTCERVCQLDCGAYGTCEIGEDDAEACVCDEGHEGAVCDLCAPGFNQLVTGACTLDLPSRTGLYLWLDADDVSSVDVARGDAVVEWRDTRNLRGAHALNPPLPSRRPDYIAAGFGGRGMVRFDGTDDRLTTTDFDGFAGEDYTVFVVAQPHSRNPGGVLSAAHPELGTTLGLDLYNPGTRFTHANAGMGTPDAVESEDFAPAAPMVLAVRRWTSGLLDHIRMYGRLDGDPMGIEVDDNLIGTPALGALNLAVGVGYDGNTMWGDVGEVLVYDRPLEDPEIREVLEYLAAKWRVP